MQKTPEQSSDARISDLEEKVRHLEQERDASIRQVKKLQAALREKEGEAQPESSEQEEVGSARLILESILENVPDGLAISDLGGRVTYCSQEGINISGMTPEEMSGSTPEKRRLGMTLYKPDGSAPAELEEMPLVQVLRTGKPVRNRELLIRHRDGKEIPIRSNAAPIRDREGNLIGAIHLWRDVSELKRTEKALRESHEKFHTFFMTTPVLTTVSTVKEGRILDVNQTFETVTGYARDEAIGKTSYELNIWRRREDRDRFGEILLHNIPLREEEAEITTKSGEKRTVLISAETIELAGEKCIIASAQDITLRKQSEGHLRALVEASSDVLYRMSPDWKEMRQLYSESFLAQTTEPNPLWLQEYILPEDQAYVTAIIEKAMRTKSVFELEHRVRRADGSLGWTHSRAVPILDEEGDIIEWFGAASDITEAKQAQQALAESEERYRTLFTKMTEGFALGEPILDEEGRPKDFRFLEINEAFEKQSGLSAEIVGQPATAALPNLESYWIESYCNVAMGGESVRFEQFNQDTGRWFDVYCYRPAEGRFAILFRDVTENRWIQERLRKSENLLKKVLKTLPVGVFILSGEGRIVQTNPAVLEIWGGTRHVDKDQFQEYKGWWADSGERIKAEEWAAARAITRGETSLDEVIDIECFDGSRKTILNSALPIRDQDGNIIGAIAVSQDITVSKRAEKALKDAKAAADEANRAKSEFLANMSHEIRTPMTVFMAAIEHLLQIDRNPERRHLLGMADRSARRLRSLIDDVLDFSRIEARKVEIEETPFDLRECIRQTLEMFALPAREKGLRLETEIAPEVPRIVTGDPGRLGQILVNLIGNAVKFTHEGEVRVCVRPRDDVQEFSVTDTGIGIPKEKRHLLFENFSQVDSSFHRQHGGSGLGLAISKGLAELMGGEISVKSRKGKGSTFTLSLPLKTLAQPSPAPAEDLPEISEAPSVARILLAEDDPMIQEMIRMMLEMKGLQPETAESGRQALTRWEEGSFDLILMDMQMPEMSGIEVTRAIREKEGKRARRTCIIGLTAHACREIKEECLAAGMDRVLTKPVRMKDLFLTIDTCLENLNDQKNYL